MNTIKFWSIKESDEIALDEYTTSVYEKILPYVKNFLCADHPFRKGAICPFVSASVKKDKIFFTYANFFSHKNIVPFEEQIDYIAKCIKFYKEQKFEKHFGSLIILFHENFPIENLLDIHLACKQKCVTNNIMLGALWDRSPAQSLHNQDYYPLRTPTPILVMRDLTVNDLIFLDPKFYDIKTRLSFLNSYIKRFKDGKQGPLSIEYLKKARYLRNKYILTLNIKYIFITSFFCLIVYLSGLSYGFK